MKDWTWFVGQAVLYLLAILILTTFIIVVGG